MDFNKNRALIFKPLTPIDLTSFPEPLTWHVIVQPYETEQLTSGGYHITDNDKDEYTKTHCAVKVLKIGELCFQTDVYNKTRPYKEGDVLIIARHGPMWVNWNGNLLGLMADDRALMKMDEKLLLEKFDGFQNIYTEFKD